MPEARTPRRRLPPEILTHAEARRLLEACDSTTAAGARNRALIAVMYRSGLRISEALALMPKDVDFDARSARVLNGKGGRARTVGLDPGALAVLDQWLAFRRDVPTTPASPLLCTVNGTPVTTAYVRRLLPRLARAAGIEKRVHAHGLRHTHAAELRAEGVDIGIISKQLGHRSIATTARYLDHIAPLDVIAAVAAREW